MGKKFNRAVLAECRGGVIGEVIVTRPVVHRANGTPIKPASAARADILGGTVDAGCT